MMDKLINFIERKWKPIAVLFVASILILCIIGLAIYRIQLMKFVGIRLMSVKFDFFAHVLTGVLWVILLGLLYLILHYVGKIKWFLTARKFSWKKILKYSLLFILFFWAFDIMMSLLYGSGVLFSVFRIPTYLYFYNRNLAIDFIINKIYFILSSYALVYLITAFFIVRAVYKRQFKTTLLFLIVFNIISYSNSFYGRLPKVIGGGRLSSVNIVFKKGYVPNELQRRIRNNEPYFMHILYEDEDKYYITFSLTNNESRRIRSNSLTINDCESLTSFIRNVNAIPKQNVLRVHYSID